MTRFFGIAARTIIRTLATILVAHFFAYVLIGLLPRTGIAILGIGAASPDVLEAFSANISVPKTYKEALGQTLTFHWGQTSYGVPVNEVLLSTIQNSIPLILISCLTILVLSAVGLLVPTRLKSAWLVNSLSFVSFLPAFLPAFAFLILSTLYRADWFLVEGSPRIWGLGIAIGIVPASLAFATIMEGFASERKKQYSTVLTAQGFTETHCHKSMRRAVIILLLPLIEKLVTLQIAILIFVEATLSYPGFGGTLLNAVRKSDVNLILASVFCISIFVLAVRSISSLTIVLADPRRS